MKVRDYREKRNHPGHTKTHTGEVVHLAKEYADIVGDRAIRVRTAGGVSVGWVDHSGLDLLEPYVGTPPYSVTATYVNQPYNFNKRDGFGGPLARVVVQW